jgi:hypothetical protein
MTNQLKSILINSSVLKIVALIFGYAFWLILAQNQSLQIMQKIPLSFYTTKSDLKITAPTEIELNLLGKRRDLQKIDPASLGTQIDISHITKAGIYPVQIETGHIFLPNNVKLLYYTPVMINLEIS